MTIELIIFDLDGTLVDSCKDITQALNYCFKKRGIEGFSQDEVNKIRAKYPHLSFTEIKAGSIKENPGHPAFYEETPFVGAVTSSRIPEDVVYRFGKAVAQGWQEVCAAYPPLKDFNPVADYFRLVPPGAEIPAHSGLIRYAKEIGIKIEPRFIPREYQGK